MDNLLISDATEVLLHRIGQPSLPDPFNRDRTPTFYHDTANRTYIFPTLLRPGYER